MKNRKVTITDVSKATGVSIATVNRALTGKPRISEETRKRIIEVANEMGYKANKAAQALSRNPIKIGAIFCGAIPEFDYDVLEGIKKAFADLADYNVTGEIKVISRKPDEAQNRIPFIKAMEDMEKRNFNGIVLLANQDVTGYDKIIDRLKRKNIFTATVVTDIDACNRVFTVKSNGIIAGKMAAELLSLACPRKKVVVFSSSSQIAICQENLIGFSQMCSQLGLELVDVYENNDYPTRAYHAVDELISSHPDAAGIYICSANSVSVCKRLEELNMGDRFFIVATDLFEDIQKYMKKGIINASLFQNPKKQGELVVKRLVEVINNSCDSPEDILILPQIVLESNREFF